MTVKPGQGDQAILHQKVKGVRLDEGGGNRRQKKEQR